jgi:hypothetical protein
VSQSRQVNPRVRRPAPPPKEADDRLVTAIGTACWAVALVVLLIFRSALPGNARWWLWTCGTGVAMGLFALWYVPFLQKRRARLAAHHAQAAEADGPAGVAAPAEPATASAPAEAARTEPGYSSRDSGSNTVSSTDTPGSSTRS